MRTLVLTTDAFGGHGGIAKYNQDFLSALCAHPDCAEVVAIPRLMPNPSGQLPAKLTYVTSGLGSKQRYLASVLKTVQSNRRFELIVCGHVNLLPIAYLLRFWIKAPVVLLIYGIDAWQPTGSRLNNRLAEKVDTFVSISDITRQRFLGWAGLDDNEGFLLPNAIDLDRYGLGPKDVSLLRRYGLADKTVLMTLGRLVSAERHKGFDEVLESLPALIGKMPDLAYLIAGDGPDRQRLEKKAKSLGLDGRVVFAGLVPEAEKADHYRLSDAYVMPSRGEGFGFVFLEAMACGIPAVGSKVDGSREALRDGKLGILVDPADPGEVEAGILEALDRPAGEVPDGLDYFSYGNFEKRCHRIVEQVLGDHKAGRAKR